MDNLNYRIERHIRTHSEKSALDVDAVSLLNSYMRSNGRINMDIVTNDTWPNIDGTFEFVINPNVSRRPAQNFFVQVKGTHTAIDDDSQIRYSLKSLAFPAYIACHVTYDPGILFVVFNADKRGQERVFWKYMSEEYVNSINYENNSTTVYFEKCNEIKNTDESVNNLCKCLEKILHHHRFISELNPYKYKKRELVRIIDRCNAEITERINWALVNDADRDSLSEHILVRLHDFCLAILVYKCMCAKHREVSIREAWEWCLLRVETKYLCAFYRSLKYVNNRIPEEGQSERLMLKYYDFLWQIREDFREINGVKLLTNLDKFPYKIDKVDMDYYRLVSGVIDNMDTTDNLLSASRYYIHKRKPFFIDGKRYYEVTLQLAGAYATKFHRVTMYTKDRIFTTYSLQIGYSEKEIELWGISTKIKVITNWKVSIDPVCLNRVAKIIGTNTKISSRYGEYDSLMWFLTSSGMNFVELIDLRQRQFDRLLESIYSRVNTTYYRDVLIQLKKRFSKEKDEKGHNVIRYLLLNMNEKTIDNVISYGNRLSDELNISTKCYPFEHNPLIANLSQSKTANIGRVKKIYNIVGEERWKQALAYTRLKNYVEQTGEIYVESDKIGTEDEIDIYNNSLDEWEKRKGFEIKKYGQYAYIENYEKTTLAILRKIRSYLNFDNISQEKTNMQFLNCIEIDDPVKKAAIENVFTRSKLLLVHGAAGTGKTTLLKHLALLFSNANVLVLTKTHTALQNVRRIIEDKDCLENVQYISVDKFIKQRTNEKFDIYFLDECSMIDNRSMLNFLEKMPMGAFLVLVGDTHQIEAIEFGNWFKYALHIITEPTSNVELSGNWRAETNELRGLWDAVRKKDTIITEKLAMDGPFSENIGANILSKDVEDEVVLCLNYDGKFGLNNINTYFQNSNKKGEDVVWYEWNYKVGDHVLFNDTKRFKMLYNNLKGKIIHIKRTKDSITFIMSVETVIKKDECMGTDISVLDSNEDSTIVQFTVYSVESISEDDEEARQKTVVPFQLAYAVSIHKSQGLEYDSVKVVIPDSNSENITHGIFYTAISRAKNKLKIYWSPETMQNIVSGFERDSDSGASFDIIKKKMQYT